MPPSGNQVSWPAVAATDADSFGIDISGTGSIVAGVQIVSRFGTVTMPGGRLGALVYQRIPWTDYSYIIYQALAVQDHSWTVLWFYCKGSALTYVYWETTSASAVRREPMTGTCRSTPADLANVSWPAVSMTAPAPIRGFRATGPLLTIGDGIVGSAAIDGRLWALYPYAVVDCSHICGSPGWFELHSFLWDAGTGDAAYAIVYLTTGQPNEARISYGLELPTLGRLPDTTFSAAWARTA